MPKLFCFQKLPIDYRSAMTVAAPLRRSPTFADGYDVQSLYRVPRMRCSYYFMCLVNVILCVCVNLCTHFTCWRRRRLSYIEHFISILLITSLYPPVARAAQCRRRYLVVTTVLIDYRDWVHSVISYIKTLYRYIL